MSFLRGLPFVVGISAVATAIIGSADAAVLRVPDPYPTIALALQSAAKGDSVLIASGSYSEHSLVLPRGVYLGSETGASGDVEIDANRLGRHLVIEDADEQTRIHGLIFRSGLVLPGTGAGGSLQIIDSSPAITACHFVDNEAGGGGAVYVHGDSSPRFEDCVFLSNLGDAGHDSFSQGGAIVIYTPPASGSVVTIVNCVFRENLASVGGAIHAYNAASLNLTSCTFVDNRCSTSQVFYGGGAVLLQGGDHLILDCVFDGNISANGGSAVEADGQIHLVIEGSTFVRHSGIDIEGNPFVANVISVSSSASVEINRSLFAVNAAHAVSGIFRSIASVQVSCTDIYGNQFGDWVGPILGMDQENENLWVDPMFCDPETGDFTLARQSLCLPANNSCGVLIGALEEGCSPLALTPESWGRIKATYRGDDALSTAGRTTPSPR